jgi:hypothetical protein
MPASRSARARQAFGAVGLFLYDLKAGPAGGRLRRPSSRRQRHHGHQGIGLNLPHQGKPKQSRVTTLLSILARRRRSLRNPGQRHLSVARVAGRVVRGACDD